MRLQQTALASVDGIKALKTSDELGWSCLHAAVIEQGPSERSHEGASNLWIATTLDAIDISFVVERGERRKQLPANAISVLAPQTPITLRIASPKVRALHVSVADSLLAEVAAELFDYPPGVEIVSDFGMEDPCLSALLKAVRRTLLDPTRHANLKIEYLARAIAADVLSKHAVQRHRPPATSHRAGLSRRQLQRVLEYIGENLSRDISLDELASVAELGRTIFIRRFKNSMKQTPYCCVMSARVRRAQDLLAKSDLPITHVAMACGFADHAHFSYVFKRLLGVTPSAYRLQFK